MPDFPYARKALIELHYLPSVQFFCKLLTYDRVVIEQHENYQKGSYRNRCHIAGANGMQVLSIPLEKGKHQKLPIREVNISYSQPWHMQHWRSIRSAYANAPFFPFYNEPLRELYQSRPTHLFAFNRQLLQLIIGQLGLAGRVDFSRDFQPETDENVDDLRNRLNPKGKEAWVDPCFHPVSYPQVFLEKHGFLPNLSILDLLFCAGPQAVSILQACIVKKSPQRPG